MKILFIGGTGLISTASSKLVVEKGHELYLLNRGNRSDFSPAGANIIKADINDVSEVENATKGMNFDAVVNWIAFTPKEIERDIKLFAGKTRQYIFISSASAYQKPVLNYLIDESTPLANPHWEYSRNKAACEDRLMEEYRKNGFPFTTVRPSLTYGDVLIPAAVTSWNNPWSLVDRMRKGKKIIVHGDGTALWSMTHNTDFAKGLVGLLGNSQAIAHSFHITTDEVLSWDQIYKTIGAAAGVTPDIIHIPTDFLMLFDPSEEGNLLGDKAPSAVFDNSKIKKFVPGFVATMSFAEGVKRTIDWFEAKPERCVVDEAWNAQCDRIIAAYELGVAVAKGAK